MVQRMVEFVQSLDGRDRLMTGGADLGLFLPQSFDANRFRLQLHGADCSAFELSMRSAEPGSDAADVARWSAVVAGPVGPTRDVTAPTARLCLARAVDTYDKTAPGLKDGGADVLSLEATPSSEASPARPLVPAGSDGTEIDAKPVQPERRAHRHSAKAAAAEKGFT